jgi:hypothetical protein
VKDIGHKWVEYLGLLAFIAVLSLVLGLLAPSTQAGKRDFIFYWKASQLLTHGADPYREQAAFNVPALEGHSEPVVILYNAPNALSFLLPLGFMNERAANIFWIFLVVTSVVVSTRLIRALNPQSYDSGLHVAAYAFAPVLLCIGAGQMSCFLLLGMVLFLLLYRQQPFWAGVALSLCMVKPHVLVPFGIALALWIIRERKYSVLYGFSSGCIVSSIVPLLFRHSIWQDYFAMMLTYHLERQFWPTLSMLFRLAVHPSSVWLQSVPVLLGGSWAIWYYLKHRQGWRWDNEHGYLLCLVSLLVAPRAWVTDEVLALPALMFLLYSEKLTGLSLWLLIVSLLVAMIEMFAAVPITSAGYIWTTTAWLACYLLATRERSYSEVQDRPLGGASVPIE